VEAQLDEPEAVFIEGSGQVPTLREFCTAFMTAPLVMMAFSLYVFVLLPVLQRLFGDDRQVEKQIISSYGAEKVPVDAPKLPFIIDNWKLWSLSNWLLIVSTLNYVSGTAPILVMIGIQSVAMFVAYLAGIHAARNDHIAEEIARHSDRYSQGVFVTGKEHHSQVAELLEEYDSVQVLNPEPE
jgi:hypothetical protein